VNGYRHFLKSPNLSTTVKFRSTILAWLFILSASLHADADLITYSSRNAFVGAASSSISTVDLEAFPVANVPSGSPLEGISFTYSLGSVSLSVVNSITTTSGTKSLGTTDRDMLLDGDNIQFSFAPQTGFGLYIISRDALLDGDLDLTVNGKTASLLSSASQINLGAGGLAWFLGVQSNDGASFTSATLTTNGGGGAFNYNLDDFVTVAAVPEPSSLWLLSVVFGTALRFRSRKSPCISE